MYHLFKRSRRSNFLQYTNAKMKSMLFVLGVALVAAVSAGPSCRRELSTYTLNNLGCAGKGIEVHDLVGKIAQGDMTYSQLASNIASKCEAANSASCYNDISSPIEGSCNEAESVQNFRNAMKTILTINEYLCQNDGQTYLDFVKDGGAECYHSVGKMKCYTDNKNAANLDNMKFKDSSICSLLEADWACLHHYNDCENKNVAVYYRQILQSLRERFSC